MMNKNFGKLVNGVLEYAPDYIDTDLGRIYNPTDTNYKFYGWKEIIRDSGNILGWYETGSTIRSINENTNYGKLVDQVIQYAPDVIKIGDNYVEPTESQYLESGFKKIIDNYGREIIRYVDRDSIYVVRLDSSHAKLVDGELVYSENMIITDDSVNVFPTDKDYLDIGFKVVIYVDPPTSPVEGYYWEPDGYEETETDISNKYKLVPIPVPEPEPRVFSKRNLELAIFNSGVPGLLAKVDAFIDSLEVTNEFGDKIPLRRLYDTALTLSEDNNHFNLFLGAIKTAVPELTDELIESILSNSVAR